MRCRLCNRSLYRNRNWRCLWNFGNRICGCCRWCGWSRYRGDAGFGFALALGEDPSLLIGEDLVNPGIIDLTLGSRTFGRCGNRLVHRTGRSRVFRLELRSGIDAFFHANDDILVDIDTVSLTFRITAGGSGFIGEGIELCLFVFDDLDHPLIDSVRAKQSVDENISGLTHAVRTADRLVLCRWLVLWFTEDNDTSRLDIKAGSSGLDLRRQHGSCRCGFKGIDDILSFFDRYGAVDHADALFAEDGTDLLEGIEEEREY